MATFSLAVDVFIGHILDKNRLRVCKIRNIGADNFYNYYHIHHLFSVNGSLFLITVYLTGHWAGGSKIQQPGWELSALKLIIRPLQSRGNLESPINLLCLGFGLQEENEVLLHKPFRYGEDRQAQRPRGWIEPRAFLLYSEFNSQHIFLGPLLLYCNGIAAPTYLVPETRVVEPLQELFAHDHGAGEEGPVCQQEVLDIGGIHHWVFLHQMHGETLCRALFKIGGEFNLCNLIHVIHMWALLRCEPRSQNVEFFFFLPWWQCVLFWSLCDPVPGVLLP